MTLEVTERDKKLLAGLAVVLVVVLLGYFGIRPLLSASTEIKSKIAQAETEREEKEAKCVELPILRGEMANERNLLDEQKTLYYEQMNSMEIDRLITGRAVNYGIEVKSMRIQTPDDGAYSSVHKYLAPKDEEAQTFDGVYAAQVSMVMEGSRENLQRMLDLAADNAPKVRVTDFSWQDRLTDEGKTLLSLDVELYMCEDIDSYIAQHLMSTEVTGQTEGQ